MANFVCKICELSLLGFQQKIKWPPGIISLNRQNAKYLLNYHRAFKCITDAQDVGQRKQPWDQISHLTPANPVFPSLSSSHTGLGL